MANGGREMKIERMQNASSMLRWETMCICLPLRLGVFMTSVFFFLQCAYYVAHRDNVPDSIRWLLGGYGVKTGIAVALLNGVGLVASFLGMVGSWFVKRAYMVWFNLWLITAVLAYFVVFYYDLKILQMCEMFVDDVQAMTTQFGWNKSMYDIAMNAQCSQARSHFLVLGVFFRLFLLYTAWRSNMYMDLVFAIPKHVLRVHKDLPVGAFYAKSTGVHGHDQADASGYAAPHRLVMTGPLEEGPMNLNQVPNYGCGGGPKMV